ncbi:unnamed protein product [Chrysoparadoxa australica]
MSVGAPVSMSFTADAWSLGGAGTLGDLEALDEVVDMEEFQNLSQYLFNEPAIGGHFYPPLDEAPSQLQQGPAQAQAQAGKLPQSNVPGDGSLSSTVGMDMSASGGNNSTLVAMQTLVSDGQFPTDMAFITPPQHVPQQITPIVQQEQNHDARFQEVASPVAAVPVPARQVQESPKPRGRPAKPRSTSKTTARVSSASSRLDKIDVASPKKARGSSKNEQQKKRRERNRVLARRTRLRKKFFFQSLQKQVAGLQQENERLKGIVKDRLTNGEEVLGQCVTELPSVVTACASQATHLLHSSDYLLMKALQNTQPSFCVTDPSLPDNPIVHASDGFFTLTGYSREQVIGRNCRFLQGPDSDPDAVAKIRKGMENGEDVSVFLKNYKADGTPFYNHVFVAALFDEKRKIINYVGIQHPVSKLPQEGESD